MTEFLKVDLRIARQQSGLSGRDVAHLLGVSSARLSKLENGYGRPKVRELICLSLIYGKPIDELFQLSSSKLTKQLKDSVSEMDFMTPQSGLKHKQRLDTLNTLTERLRSLNPDLNEA